MSQEKAYKITLFGKVQGVFIRKTIKDFADQLGLVGYAKNKKDGSVEIFAQGPTLPLTNFLNFCKQGSQFSRIDVVKHEEVLLGTYHQFKVM